MIRLDNAVKQHKRLTEQLIKQSSLSLTIKLPAPKVTGTVNPLYGDMTRERSKAGETKGPYKCLWYDALTATSTSSSGVETTIETLAGQFVEATAFAEVWLNDVLVDPSNTSGKTWFEEGMYVIFNGQRYKYLGCAKLGLATSAPYFLMIALKGGAAYDDQ